MAATLMSDTYIAGIGGTDYAPNERWRPVEHLSVIAAARGWHYHRKKHVEAGRQE